MITEQEAKDWLAEWDIAWLNDPQKLDPEAVFLKVGKQMGLVGNKNDKN